MLAELKMPPRCSSAVQISCSSEHSSQRPLDGSTMWCTGQTRGSELPREAVRRRTGAWLAHGTSIGNETSKDV